MTGSRPLRSRGPLALRLVLASILASLALAASLAAAPAAHAATLRQQADAIMNKDYKSFVAYKKKVLSTYGPYVFNWTDDGCSNPTPPAWKSLFNQPCQIHDFGYRNYGRGLKLGRNEDTRAWIDKRLLQEMVRLCKDKYSAWYRYPNKVACLDEAGIIYTAVRNGGRGAFYG
jgi:hypothetical protein